MKTYRILPVCLLSVCLPLIVCACSKLGPSPLNDGKAAKPAPGTMIATPPVPVLPVDKRFVGNNLIEDGGFERAMGGEPVSWKLDAAVPCKVERVQDCYAEGQYSLRVAVPGNQSFEATQRVENHGHKEYVFRCLVLAKDVSGQVRLAVCDTAENGKIVSAQSEAITGTRTEWTPLQVEFAVPATILDFAVALRHEAAGEGSSAMGTVWFDQCELYMLGEPSRQNLLRNGDFSEGPIKKIPSNWGWWMGQTISRDSDVQMPQSLKVDCRPEEEVTFVQPVEDVVKPGQRYVLRGYMKTSNSSGRATLEVGKQGWILTATKPVSSPDWTWVKLPFTAPDDCKGLLALLYCRRDKEQPASPCTVWFAHVELLAANDKE